jgi:pimeloyl-ACP methyl ester carboxylesterase
MADRGFTVFNVIDHSGVAGRAGVQMPAPGAPAGTVTAQGHAVDQWWAGLDPASQQGAKITAPTLIADGTADRLDPPANSHALAGLIPRAKLTLYPDAGHAFLFQD